MTRLQAGVPAVLTGRVFWDHVWHKSKTSPCAMQERPSALSTVSRMAPGHCRTSLSLSLRAWVSRRGVQYPWGRCSPLPPPPGAAVLALCCARSGTVSRQR